MITQSHQTQTLVIKQGKDAFPESQSDPYSTPCGMSES